MTIEEAKQAVAEYYERVVLTIYPVNAYPCHTHGCFHIGHQRPREEILAFRKLCIEICYSNAA